MYTEILGNDVEFMKFNQIAKTAYIGLMAVITAVCSQICLPTVVPFTLQTFAIICAIELLGAKDGFLTVILYIAMGIVGLPVFSGMQTGAGALFGAGGGYIIGFAAATLIYWVLETKLHKIILRVLWLFTDYVFGALWYALLYTSQRDFCQVIMICVVPFVIPDIIKMLLAVYVAEKVQKLRREA